MYKVVLIDDEPTITMGLKKIIPWEDFDCYVAADARDGSEGIRMITQYEPEILITDICMPDMSGLSMISGIKHKFPDMQVAVLTAHKSFEYAQRSINLGVVRYLVKPSKMNELLETVSVMTSNLNNKKHPSDDGDLTGSFVVNNVLRYMDENYNKRLMLEEVAEAVYISRWHLSKLLKKHTNRSFSETLNRIRISKAKLFMKDAALRLCDISEICGFNDAAHFSKIFKEIEGMPANEYRNSQI